MKTIYVLSIVLALAAAQKDTYTTENDDFDVEALVSNLDSLKAFNNCFTDSATCDPVAADFKKDIAEAVSQSCAKCTPAQKHIFKRYLEVLKEKLPQEYEAFKNKYDAEGKKFEALEKAVASF